MRSSRGRKALDRLRKQDARERSFERLEQLHLEIPSRSGIDSLLPDDGLGEEWDDIQDERLRRCVGQMQPLDRGMLRLKLDGFKQKEIARIVSLSEPRVSERLAQALLRLREALDGDQTGRRRCA